MPKSVHALFIKIEHFQINSKACRGIVHPIHSFSTILLFAMNAMNGSQFVVCTQSGADKIQYSKLLVK